MHKSNLTIIFKIRDVDYIKNLMAGLDFYIPGGHPQNHNRTNHERRLSVPVMWWRKPCGGLDGHGTSSIG